MPTMDEWRRSFVARSSEWEHRDMVTSKGERLHVAERTEVYEDGRVARVAWVGPVGRGSETT